MCDLKIARQAIVEMLIIDKQRQIDYLKNEIDKYRSSLISSDFLKKRWESLFKKLNWKYEILNNNNELAPDFRLKTKKFKEYSIEETVNGEFKIPDKPSDIYIIPNLPNSSIKLENIDYLKNLTSNANKNHRLIIVSDKLIEDLSSLKFGWNYEFINGGWNEVSFVKKDEKLGLLDEEETLFCMITGELLKRDHLYPNTDNTRIQQINATFRFGIVW